jgi:hypothetical protein
MKSGSHVLLLGGLLRHFQLKKILFNRNIRRAHDTESNEGPKTPDRGANQLWAL